MPLDLKENFISNMPLGEINDSIIEIVISRKGKILTASDNYVKSKFGNRLLVRLFGIGLLGMLKMPLPLILEIKIKIQENEKNIELYLYDNLGRFGYRDPLTKSAYNKLFKEIYEEIKGSCA